MGGSTSNFLYSVEVPGTGNAQETPIYLHPQAKPYLATSLINGAASLYEVLTLSSEKHADLPFLGFRQDDAYV
jgi:hypothetical protein